MRIDRRVLVSVAILAGALALSYLIPVAQKSGVVATSFPAQACPAIPLNGTTLLNLPTAKLPIRSIQPKNIKFVKSRGASFALSKTPILVDSNPGTSLVSSSSTGIGYVLCSTGSPEEWFLGGIGGVSSKGILQLVNTGLSQASVAIYPYSSQGALPVVQLKVSANSAINILLDSLVPGDDTMALRVVTLSGRMSSFLLDHRKKGLRELGIEYVASQGLPSKTLIIPILVAGTTTISKPDSSLNSLRFLVPGELDATVKVEITASDGTFVPLGFDQITIEHGKVRQIPLSNLRTTGAISIKVTSDQPLLASGFTGKPGGDFAWVSAAPALHNLSINFGGETPVVLFSGEGIAVDIYGRTSQGKAFSKSIRGPAGASARLWNPKVGINSVTFKVRSDKAIFAGAILNSGGISYLPLVSGAQESNTNLPLIDLRTLTH